MFFFYFKWNGCVILSTGREMQGFKAKVLAVPHLPLFNSQDNF